MFLRDKKKAATGEGVDGVLRNALGDLSIPSFPSVILETLDVLRDPEVSAERVAETLRPDPGATVRLLRLVNSASYGPATEIRSVSQAVAMAGLGTVESMLMAVGVKVALPNVDVEGLQQRRFWQAAARRACIARTFANELHPATADQSFTAGLLQDMAVPLLALARENYRPLLVEWHHAGGDLSALEAESFGWSHDQVAAELCAEWKLPSELTQAIGGHHGAEGFDVPDSVSLAAPLREVYGNEALEEVVDLATGTYGLSSDRTIELLDEAESESTEIAQLFI